MFVQRAPSRLLKVGVGVLMVGALAVVPRAPLAAQEEQQSLDDASGRSLGLYHTFSTASDRGTRFQISDHGNLITFTSPNSAGAVYEHIAIGSLSEGYVTCYTPVGGALQNRYDVGGAEFGWGPNIAPGPPNVTRRTTDGMLELKQQYAFNTTNKSLQITMTLKNVSGTVAGIATTLNGVILRRQADFDVDTGGAQAWAAFANRFAADGAVQGDGVAAWNDRVDAPAGKEAHATALRHISGNFTHEAKVTASILDTSCSPVHHNTAGAGATGYARADLGATIQYSFGTLKNNQSRKVIVQYVRY